MALDIYTNNYSIAAQNNLNIAGASLQKSIERLSSGLRINHAADDASGLAISEKLRGQIRGLAKASMNAQDATSMLQTAEGGMEAMGDMLQRMRELAVQAGNGAYTSNDRKELQKEVDQLKEEINRVSASTEFNTKKLLTGDAAAIWSTDSPSNLEAIVRGTPAEGNYRLDVTREAGEADWYKSNIMTTGVRKGSEDYNLVEGGTGITSFKGFKTDTSINVDVTTAATASTAGVSYGKLGQLDGGSPAASVAIAANGARTGYYEITAKNSSTTNIMTNDDFEITLYGADGSKKAISGKSTLGADSFKFDATAGTIEIAGSAAANKVTLTVGQNVNISKGDKLILKSQELTAIGATVSIKDSNSGFLVAGGTGEIKLADYEITSGGNIRLTNSGSVTNATTKGTASLKQSSGNIGVTTEGFTNGDVITITTAAADIPAKAEVVKTAANAAAVTIEAAEGDKYTGDTGYYTVSFKKAGAANSLTNNDLSISFVGADGVSKKIDSNEIVVGTDKITFRGMDIATTTDTVSTTDSVIIKAQSAIAGSNFVAEINSSELKFDLSKGNSDKGYSIADIRVENGSVVTKSSGKLTFPNGAQDTGVIAIKEATSDPATINTKLKDLAGFTNKDGRNLLDNTQTLEFFANGKTGSVTLEGNDTIGDLVKKMNDGFSAMGLGSSVVSFGTLDGVDHVFSFQSETTEGKDSEIRFMADEGVINALGVTKYREGKNAETTVQVTDAHNGNVIGKDTVSDDTLRGVIQGIDVRLSGKGDTTHYLHVKDNRTEVQIGANEGQKFDISIGEMNTKSLEIDDAFVVTMEDSQKAITKFDQALSKVNSARATIGAQINRLEYTTKNLAVSKQNLVAAESRIRDLDVAEESSNFSKNQILNNAALAMLAQANQLPQAALQLIGR